jgi:hypothetical protein
MTPTPTLAMVCDACNRRVESVSFIKSSIPCECGKMMHCLTIPIDNSPPPRIGRVVPLGYELLLEAINNRLNIGDLRRSYWSFGRRDDIEWIKGKMCAYMVRSKEEKFPIVMAIKIALCIDVSEDVALDYVRQIEDSGVFKTDGKNFIIDKKYAEKYLEVSDAQS